MTKKQMAILITWWFIMGVLGALFLVVAFNVAERKAGIRTSAERVMATELCAAEGGVLVWWGEGDYQCLPEIRRTASR